MGVLPLQFNVGESWKKLGLDGSEVIMIEGISQMKPMQILTVTAYTHEGTSQTFEVLSRLDTPVDMAYYLAGGILPLVLRHMAIEENTDKC